MRTPTVGDGLNRVAGGQVLLSSRSPANDEGSSRRARARKTEFGGPAESRARREETTLNETALLWGFYVGGFFDVDGGGFGGGVVGGGSDDDGAGGPYPSGFVDGGGCVCDVEPGG